jgi:tetratricopeptide (TPR) repeat protein
MKSVEKLERGNLKRLLFIIILLFIAFSLFLFSNVHLISQFIGSDVTGDRSFAEEEKSPAFVSFQKAQKHFSEGEYAAASTLLKEILAREGDNHDARNLLGWCHYRMGGFKDAEEVFDGLLKDFPDSVDALSGLAYSKYQGGEYLESEELFRRVLTTSPENGDALKGLALVKKKQGDLLEAKALLERAHAVHPEDPDLKKMYEQVYFATLDKDRRRNKPLSKNTPLKIRARTGMDYLAVHEEGKWRNVFIKGVNLGVALPGKFPAEFPMDKDVYLGWLEKIAEMNANTIRVYTLLPPVFYKALGEHNRKEGVNKLWLIQGVWVELPPEHDFYNAEFMDAFKADIARVIDAVHGNIDIIYRPGHAFGRYEDDVSDYLLAMILGREWEPFSVIDFNEGYPEIKKYQGQYFTAKEGNPMECWIAEICDFTAGYESDRYREQHPLSFSNWPTLDPLTHPTETSKAEENEIKKKLGMEVEPILEEVYDDDSVSVDAGRIVPTKKMKAGFFASYHIYPYHPDFLNLDPGYSRSQDSEGRNNYFGYLKDVKEHHRSQPLLVAEFGVPTSRGISHFQPQGMNHGGHTEMEQGEVCQRLMENIIEAKCAGGLVFSWIDEWFKKNWLTVDFENPLERNPLWFNTMDPEQNYGLLAMKPGKNGWKIKIDGKEEDWKGMKPWYRDRFLEEEGESFIQKMRRKIHGPLEVRQKFRDGFDGARDLKKFYVTHDEGYLYMKLEVLCLDCDQDGEVDWDYAHYFIGIDTYRRDLGEFKFPGAANFLAPSGMEFLIELKGYEQSRILVDEPYDIYIHTIEGWGPYQSQPNKSGRFKELRAETNRERYGRDGTVFPPVTYSKSPLRYGSMERGSVDYDSQCDWKLNKERGFIELRIPWALLNVTDPSSRRVLHQEGSHLPPLETVETKGFIFYTLSAVPGKREDAVADILPLIPRKSKIGGAAESTIKLNVYLWERWENPNYHAYPKDSYYVLKDDFLNIKTYIIK